MLLKVETKDICITCIHKADCLIPMSNSRRPIVYCEQFDDFEPVPKSNVHPKPMPEVKGASYSESEEFQFKGLCINCDHRETCSFARQEGGVWHCEEYR